MMIDQITSRTDHTPLSRRGFLQTSAALGGGLMLSLSLPMGRGEAATAEEFAPNAFIRIGSDGQVVLTMPYVEMGQGTVVGCAGDRQLECDARRVEAAAPGRRDGPRHAR
jgi:isoquinoline 1-oxidoreductase beta subunit